jgi:hypothetical protein
MSAYSLTATNVSQQSPVLKKGVVRLYSSVTIYFMVGSDPIIDPAKCALLRAGESRDMRFPVKCSKIAVQAVGEHGVVTIIEQGGQSTTKASCVP